MVSCVHAGFAVTVSVRLGDLLGVVPIVYVGDTRLGFDLEAEVVVAPLCDGEASL